MSAFRPARGLAGPNLQTIAGGVWPRTAKIQRSCNRFEQFSRDEILDCGDGVRLHGLFAERQHSRGFAVLLHGWEGGARSTYQISVGHALWSAGWSVFRLNLRDHGGSHHLNPGLFHSCRILEVVGAFSAIAARWDTRPLVTVGFSLGGNFALRVALRAPAAGIPLERVVAVSPAIDPATIMTELERGPFVYRGHFLRRWWRSLQLKQAAFPDLYDFSDVAHIRDLRRLTDVLIRRHSEFETVEQYWDGYSIGRGRLAGLRIRSTVVAAEDDPIIPISDIRDLPRTGALDLELHRHGGHCGFIDSWALDCWLDRRVPELLGTT